MASNTESRLTEDITTMPSMDDEESDPKANSTIVTNIPEEKSICATVTSSQNAAENIPLHHPLDNQVKPETNTVLVSSSLPKSITDISSSNFSKDIKDPCGVHGSCGLYNLGNTCFMNSGLQSLLSNSTLVKFFLNVFVLDDGNRDTLLGQFYRLLHKVWSGHFSVVHPNDFKECLGVYHSQFQDYRQHDCQEFLVLLLDTFHEQLNTSNHVSLSNNEASLSPSRSQNLEPLSNSLRSLEPHTSLEPCPNTFHSLEPIVTVPNALELNSNTFEPLSNSLYGSERSNVIEKNTNAFEPLVNSLLTVESPSKPLNHLLNNQEASQTMAFDGARQSFADSCDMAAVSPSKPNVVRDFTYSCSATSASFTMNGSTVVESSFPASTISDSAFSPSDDSNQSNASVHSNDSDHSLNIGKIQLQSDASKSPPSPMASSATSLSEFTVDIDVNRRNNTQSIRNMNTSNVCHPLHYIDSKTDIYNMIPTKADNISQLNNICSPTLPSTLLEYYGKETKTLNTNVLVFESTNEEVSIDSDKFAKQDNRVRTDQEEVNILQEALAEEDKTQKEPISFGIKDTNLRVGQKGRMMFDSSSVVMETDDTLNMYELNNIKRIKIDSSEPMKLTTIVESDKNVQMQEMSKFNTLKALPEDLSDAESSADSMYAEDADSSDEEGGVISRSSSMNGLPFVVDCVNNRTELFGLEADTSWNKYLMQNNSVIVSTFQGQFQSTVVCCVCSHVSVTYEPFMYLSLPVPRAMDRQICVIFISCGNTPTRYLLNLRKNDKVHSLKKELLRLLEKTVCDIIVAETLDSHISRILDDNIMLRFVNDTTRNIYAFEMVQPLLPAVEVPLDNDATMATKSSISSKQTANSLDIFSNMAIFTSSSSSTVPFQSNLSHGSTLMDVSGSELSDWSSVKVDPAKRHMTSPVTSLDGTTNDMAGTGLWEWTHTGFPSTCEPPWDNNVASTSTQEVASIVEQWKTCAICLEELCDNELLTHHSCNGTFCQNCLEMSAKHCTDAGYCCPICLLPANMNEDFLPLISSSSYKPKLRVIALPVAFRHDCEHLFGHPAMLYVPNRLPGRQLYDMVDSILPCCLTYALALTDGQGLNCSRCTFTAHCSGCLLDRDSEVMLQPGDNLTVHLMENNTQHFPDECVDHMSMEDLRSNDPITIYDCFKAFTESEMLDEHNPWFCPQCQENQCAKKTMTVWRYPDTLIVHLKRFVFQDLSSTKIDNQVVFPQRDLNLSSFVSGPMFKDTTYDLYSLVCHFGGSHSGHYTSYSLHPLTSEWFYYNDENVSKHEPKTEDYNSAYVLFYQRKGTNSKFQPPSGPLAVPENEPTPANSSLEYTSSLPSPVSQVASSSHQDMIGSSGDKSAIDQQCSETDCTTYDFYS